MNRLDSDPGAANTATDNSRSSAPPDDALRLVPELTAELLLKNLELQNCLRERTRSPFADAADPRRARLETARREAQNGLIAIELLEKQKSAAQSAAEKVELTQLIEQHSETAAMFFADLGKFVEAAVIAPNKALEQMYAEFAAAEKLPDELWCEHAKWTTSQNGKPINNYYREFSFFSEEQNREIAMLRCNQCGFKNAVATLPDDLRRLSEVRKNATT